MPGLGGFGAGVGKLPGVPSVLPELQALALRVDERLDALLPAPDRRPSNLHQAMRYSCLASGKRLRPGLCLASAAAVGGRESDAMDAACALEMLHCFSLIHDDLPAIDDDHLRRGRPTCHIVYGEAIAVLAGDALFALALEVLATMDASPEVRVRALQILTRAAGSDGLVGGEVVDVEAEGSEPDADTLHYIHTRKTGALMAASCEIGALVGGGSPEQVAALGRFGLDLGLAFQIADDLLNELGSEDQLGKAAGSDRARGKATYPALYGVERSREMARQTVDDAIRELGTVRDTGLLRGLAEFSIERVA